MWRGGAHLPGNLGEKCRRKIVEMGASHPRGPLGEMRESAYWEF